MPNYIIGLSVDWVPPPVLRGNYTGSWRARIQPRRAAVELGIALGREYRNTHPETNWPLDGPLALTVITHTPRAVDYDNLLIGYKPFIDGLQQFLRDKSEGAGLIIDDKQIKDARIVLATGPEYSEILLALR